VPSAAAAVCVKCYKVAGLLWVIKTSFSVRSSASKINCALPHAEREACSWFLLRMKQVLACRVSQPSSSVDLANCCQLYTGLLVLSGSPR
jgi:hypothetical protein